MDAIRRDFQEVNFDDMWVVRKTYVDIVLVRVNLYILENRFLYK